MFNVVFYYRNNVKFLEAMLNIVDDNIEHCVFIKKGTKIRARYVFLISFIVIGS